ncbi:PREDICTED: cuticle protein 18.7-like [Acromyrmex echinatior]|uniref:cuticle protein 18.7-like n=1 Tax=Acromyrmex echinatior TaxID=103372 RepID=UPI000580C9D2|nr:PREDICTED: cuticle protein 18.7-like [Acromyrmex echinatior]
MILFAIVLLGLTSLVSAKPTFLSVPLTYATPLTALTSDIQVGINSGALDGPETAHINERTELANGIASSAVGSLRERQSLFRDNAPPITSSAPLGTDGRVVDTPEVAAAKVAHAAAHVHERINLANEIARSNGGALVDSSDVADSRILNAPEVATARANGKISPMNEVARSSDALPNAVNGRVVPLVLGNNVIATLVPISPNGKPLDVPEVAARGDQNLANDVKSVDALAIAGRALAYGRLVY